MAILNRRNVLALSATSLLARTQWCCPALAQADYPSKPVHVLIPFAAGGGQDAFARIFVPLLTGDVGKRAYIDNKPGGNSVIATEITVHARPDGYTLLQQTNSFTANPVLLKTLTFDSRKDLTPVSLVARTPHVLIVNSKLPAQTVQEFIDVAKSSKTTLNYGSGGIGSTNHLAALLLAKAIGVEMEHIAYKGSSEFIRDLVSGEIQLALGGSGQATSLVKGGGKVRALAVTAASRLPSLPDVPTFKELGLEVEIYSWTGYLAPAKTPSDIIEKLSSIMQATCRDPKVREKFPEHELIGSTPAEFARFLADDFTATAELLKSVKLE
jgi:tripartite-type tricarboxylate transporter receptor subunit TctC